MRNKITREEHTHKKTKKMNEQDERVKKTRKNRDKTGQSINRTLDRRYNIIREKKRKNVRKSK